MKHHMQVAIIFLFTLLSFTLVHAQSNPLAELDWQIGPTQGSIGNKAKIHIPDGYVFLGKEDTKKLVPLANRCTEDWLNS